MPDIWSVETQAIDAQLDAKQDLAEKDQADGYAGLDGTGKIDASQLPSIAIGENLGAVGSQAAMLALGADPGDSCQRTDFTPAQVWLCLDTPSNDIANWAAITGYVTSVNGQAGVVTLDARDVSAVALAEVLAAAEEITIDATTAAHTAHSVIAITHRSGASGLCVIDLDQNQAGFTAHAFHAHLTSGVMATGTDSGALLVTFDTSSSTGGHIDGLHLQRAIGNGAEVAGVHSGSGVAPIHQVSGTETAPTVLKYNGAYTDISAAAASASSDVALWEANGDIVYIGHASEFDEIKFAWNTTASNAGIKPTFEFWNGSAWTSFSAIDGTKGGKKAGVISFTSANLTGWADTAVDGITKRWVRITRTANTLTTPPIEDKITVVIGTQYEWDELGNITANSITVGNLTANGTISGISAGDVGADPAGSAASAQAAAIAASAPIGAKYLVATANGSLTDEVDLGAGTTGILKRTVALGVATISNAVAGTDFETAGAAATVQGNLQNHLDDTSAAHLASAIGYTPATSGDWSPAPTTDAGANDQLAARVKTLEGASATVTTSSPLSGNGSSGSPITLPTSATPTIVSLTLSQTTGTKPLTISSTTLNDNLNADLLDGFHASKTAAGNLIPVTEAGGGLKAEHTATGTATAGYVQISSGVGAVPAWGPQTVSTSTGTTGGTGLKVYTTSPAPVSMAQNETVNVQVGALTIPSLQATGWYAGTAATNQTFTTWDFDAADESLWTQEDATNGTDFRDGVVALHHADSAVKFLLNADGTDGAANIVDQGYRASANTWTANAGATHSTSDAPTGWSSAWVFGGGKYLQLAATTDMLWSSGTFQFWIKVVSYPANPGIVFSTADNTTSFGISNAGTIDFYFDTTSHNSTAGAVSTGVWTHIAAVKNGTNLKLYVGGVEKGSFTVGATIGSSGSATTWGWRSTGGLTLDAKVTGISFTTAVLWTSGFTPPSSPTTAGYPTASGYYVYPGSTIRFPITRVANFDSITITQTEPTNTTMRYLMSWDDGVTWKDHNGSTVAIANIHTSGATAAQLGTYFNGLVPPVGSSSLIIAPGLKTSDATVTPSVSQITLQYDENTPWVLETPSYTFKAWISSVGSWVECKNNRTGTSSIHWRVEIV